MQPGIDFPPVEVPVSVLANYDGSTITDVDKQTLEEMTVGAKVADSTNMGVRIYAGTKRLRSNDVDPMLMEHEYVEESACVFSKSVEGRVKALEKLVDEQEARIIKVEKELGQWNRWYKWWNPFMWAMFDHSKSYWPSVITKTKENHLKYNYVSTYWDHSPFEVDPVAVEAGLSSAPPYPMQD